MPMKYVDGYVIPIPKKNLAEYRRVAGIASKVWMKHGALEYFEAVGEDMNMKFGLPFPKLVKLRPNETVIFAWIVFKSRAQRDKVNAKVMNDLMAEKSIDHTKPIFDHKRMSWGGFDIIVEGKAKKPVKRRPAVKTAKKKLVRK